MEQLIFIAIFLLAALVDLLVRWMRGKTKAPESDEELVVVQEEPEEAAEWEWLEPRAEERKPEPLPVQPAPIRAPALEEIVVRRPAREPAPLPAPPRRRARGRRRISGPVSARQGIVAMTILGPCRALE